MVEMVEYLQVQGPEFKFQYNKRKRRKKKSPRESQNLRFRQDFIKSLVSKKKVGPKGTQ
jgi:hypothetical protein